MKRILTTLLGAIFFIGINFVSYSQVIDPKKEAEKEGTQRINEKIDKGIDKGFDKLEEGIGKLFGKKKKKDKKGKEQPADQQTDETVSDQEQTQTSIGSTSATPALVWSKYDFVPGDKVIFEDNLAGEENGEFPSRWDLQQGNVEVAQFGGENVIMFRDGSPTIMPYLKNPSEDYLPDVFTIEFDLYTGESRFWAYLYDRMNQESGSSTGYTYLVVDNEGMEFGRSESDHPDADNLAERRWIHVAMAYTNGKLKAYMDETRLINLPRLDFDPKGLSLHSYHASNEDLYYIKNIRIAEGGVKYYDRVMEDGKIIATGIRFDIGKATLKPESMGIINKITQLMKDHPELKFSIEGHTDSDGDDSSNLKLSEERAQTVKNTMVKLGISAGRLSIKGMGETAPIDINSSPEGKANNRRVEFVKI
ncbi:MAG: OmpA family protein [Bacteroidota bacterium]